MSSTAFSQILLLLGSAVVIVMLFQRLRIPSSLGYLLVGFLLSAYTPGPVIESGSVNALAEFGLIFLLFTIGLNFSLPQIHALRGLVLGLGTAQVFLCTFVIALLIWCLGFPLAAAFVVGAVFAQSSTTIISRVLGEQGEEYSRHGRLAIAMSVFQDVTAVPILVIIPALTMSDAGIFSLLSGLALALGKTIFAFVLIFMIGRRILLPLFHVVAKLRSAEMFTLTVLWVSLASAWIANALGLSMAFGAFLAGMVIGETEFRHQVESTIRPFRDVLLGLFFVGIGMLIDLSTLWLIWPWALGGAFMLMFSKVLLVALIARLSHIDTITSWRMAWILSVGGEFGFALLAVSLALGAIDAHTGQIVLASVLLSCIIAPFFIRYNDVLAKLLSPNRPIGKDEIGIPPQAVNIGQVRDHVLLCGYGRIGQNVAHFLEKEKISYVALDLDPLLVKDAYLAGEPIFYGDASEKDILEAGGLASARLVVVTLEGLVAVRKILHHIRAARPDLPIMVRTRDERHTEELRAAGATEIVPETLEAGLVLAMHVMTVLQTPFNRVIHYMREQRKERYHLLREFFPGDPLHDSMETEETHTDRLRPLALPEESPAVGRALGEIIDLDTVVATVLVRKGRRHLRPAAETILEAGDVLVLFGSPEELQRAEHSLFA